VLDQQFTRPEELQKAEHEVAEDEVTLLGTLRRLRSSQKEKCQFATVDSSSVISNKDKK